MSDKYTLNTRRDALILLHNEMLGNLVSLEVNINLLKTQQFLPELNQADINEEIKQLKGMMDRLRLLLAIIEDVILENETKKDDKEVVN